MSNEKQLPHTHWDPEKQKWLLYLTPEAPRPDLVIDIDIRQFQERILDNPTFKKFCNRLAENFNAITNNKTQTQQREGGYWPQIASTISLATILWFINNLGPIFAFLRWENPEKTPDGSSNPARKKIEEASIITLIAFYLIYAIAFYTFFYFNFHSVDREKKQKQFFELMKDILKRKPAIEKEIDDKNEAVSLLTEFLKMEDQNLQLDVPLLPLNSIPSYLANKEKRQRSGLMDVSAKIDELADIENQLGRPPHNQAATSANLIDLLKLRLDAEGDLQSYKNIYVFIKSLYQLLNDRRESEIKEILLCLVKFKLKEQYARHISNIKQIELQNIKTFSDLINYIKQLTDVDDHSRMPLAYFIVEQVVLLLKDQAKLLACNDLINLLAATNIPTNIHSVRANENMLYLTFMQCEINFKDQKFKLDNIHDYLSQLNEHQREKLIAHIKKLFFQPADKITVDQIIATLIATLSQKNMLAAIIGITSGSPALSLPTIRPLKPFTSQRNPYFGHVAGISRTLQCTYNKNVILFDVYKTLGDGNCGFYSLPIPYDRNGIEKLLLAKADREDIRTMVANEMMETLMTSYFPIAVSQKYSDIAKFIDYLTAYDIEKQQLLSSVLDKIDPKRELIPDRQFDNVVRYLKSIKPEHNKKLQQLIAFNETHEQRLQEIRAFLARKKVFEEYVKEYVGKSGELSFGRSGTSIEREKGLLDAILLLIKPSIHLVIWHSEPSSDKGYIVYEGGPKEGTITHIYHRPGRDTHFELMAASDVESIENPERKVDAKQKDSIKGAEQAKLFKSETSLTLSPGITHRATSTSPSPKSSAKVSPSPAPKKNV